MFLVLKILLELELKKKKRVGIANDACWVDNLSQMKSTPGNKNSKIRENTWWLISCWWHGTQLHRTNIEELGFQMCREQRGRPSMRYSRHHAGHLGYQRILKKIQQSFLLARPNVGYSGVSAQLSGLAAWEACSLSPIRFASTPDVTRTELGRFPSESYCGPHKSFERYDGIPTVVDGATKMVYLAWSSQRDNFRRRNPPPILLEFCREIAWNSSSHKQWQGSQICIKFLERILEVTADEAAGVQWTPHSNRWSDRGYKSSGGDELAMHSPQH